MKGQRQDFVAVTLYSGASNTETRIAMDFFCGGVDLPFYMWCTTQVELWKKKKKKRRKRGTFFYVDVHATLTAGWLSASASWR